ncbi:5'-methylthioadenosine/S-adenosylhomocysteine nucleosidase [Spiroplasma chrysopicola]|uniref:adenosylhomocysteine nucleosidase n=1 Tax=Spiroplasma chrysopicola DF-1 TaxID=1276227 RepID=R4U181_9MOLU|nr:5'-methylthioadenosine/S-adenosylhomocysteine nucleosidase [Spiroplasma chrysopicola]AGM25092.1 5'-methylthioadenosine/S-adenosylhomocysteine nucleosidase [Spiroplasma chrysopicola DF-1]
MKLVISAMAEELGETLASLEPQLIHNNNGLKVYQKDDWLFAITKIGQVNATIALTTIIKTFEISKIFNLGTAGSLIPTVKIQDVVIIEKAYYTFADATVFGYQLGQIPQEPFGYQSDQTLMTCLQKIVPDVKVGLLGTSDVFINSPNHLAHLQAMPIEITVSDMEGTAFFQTAYSFNIPIVAVKIISDQVFTPTNSKVEFKNNLLLASKKIKNIIDNLMLSC